MQTVQFNSPSPAKIPGFSSYYSGQFAVHGIKELDRWRFAYDNNGYYYLAKQWDNAIGANKSG